MNTLAGEPPMSLDSGHSRSDDLLAVAGISRRFGGLAALTDVSLSVRRGQVTAVIGPNGAGKTTMFNIVSGITRPDAGSVTFDGKDITRWSPHKIAASGLARTFQNIRVFESLNVQENVMAAQYCRLTSGLVDTLLWLPKDRGDRALMRDEAQHWLDWVGIADKKNQKPRELPYGDQRRLEIARALATKPSLLLLDEPTAGMVTSEAIQIVDLIRRLTDIGLTVVLIEHNMNVVMSISDHVAVLDFGRKIGEGLPASVRSDPVVIEAYLGPDE